MYAMYEVNETLTFITKHEFITMKAPTNMHTVLCLFIFIKKIDNMSVRHRFSDSFAFVIRNARISLIAMKFLFVTSKLNNDETML